jgi:hypothetical protein
VTIETINDPIKVVKLLQAGYIVRQPEPGSSECEITLPYVLDVYYYTTRDVFTSINSALEESKERMSNFPDLVFANLKEPGLVAGFYLVEASNNAALKWKIPPEGLQGDSG